jgi:hypothetical protein
VGAKEHDEDLSEMLVRIEVCEGSEVFIDVR